jgi:hypothetical protein
LVPHHVLIQGHQDLLLFSVIFIAEELDGVWDGARTATVDVQTLLVAFWTCPWDLPVLLMELFTPKNQTLPFWDYSPQVSDYHDFWFIRCWIKGVLLYFLLRLFCLQRKDRTLLSYITRQC